MLTKQLFTVERIQPSFIEPMYAVKGQSGLNYLSRRHSAIKFDHQ